MALTTKSGILVTGDKALDRALANLPVKLQKKHIRKALRNIGKTVMFYARLRTPKDLGAMAAAFQVRNTSRTIKSGTGKFREATAKNGHQYRFEVQRTVGTDMGVKVEITRKSLEKQVQKRGDADKASRITEEDKGFYPAFVELGGPGHGNGHRPMRSALKSSESYAVREFRQELMKLIRSTTVRDYLKHR